MMDKTNSLIATELTLEERIARIEGKIGWREERASLPRSYLIPAFAVGILALVSGLLGLGFPNHPYQVVLAILLTALLYHQSILAFPMHAIGWSIAALNALMISTLFKLLIGGGMRYPLGWLLYPTIGRTETKEADKAWIDVVPDWSLQWQKSPIADWSIDLTVVQTFLLVITLVGALFQFQPFISLTAFLLVLISIPALVGFNWDFVFPAIVLTAISLYLQSRDLHAK